MDKRQADQLFGKLKSQEQINRDENRENLLTMLEDVCGALVIFAILIGGMTMPSWLPIVAAWWPS